MIRGAEEVIRKWPRRVVAIVVAAGMVAATVVAALWIMRVDEKPPEAPGAQVKRVAVEVAEVTPANFTHEIQALGTVKPLREASLAPQVSGPIVEVPEGIDLGSSVEEGQLLARISEANFRIAVQEAQAQLAQKRAALEEQHRESEKRAVLYKIAEENVSLVNAEAERMEALFKEGVISRSERDAAHERLTQARGEFERTQSEYRSADAAVSRVAAEIGQAEARLARAEKDLSDTRIRAPFPGLIAEKSAELGDHASVGQGLFRLVDISRVKVLVNIATEDIHAVRQGAQATVSVAPFPDRPFEGLVANVGYESEMKNRTFPVEVIVENPSDLPLRAGMFATVRMAVRTYENVILIDRRLITQSSDGPIVFVADQKDQVARARPVRLGRIFGDRYQVLRGLERGELIVTEGVDLLSDGAPILLPGAATASTD